MIPWFKSEFLKLINFDMVLEDKITKVGYCFGELIIGIFD